MFFFVKLFELQLIFATLLAIVCAKPSLLHTEPHIELHGLSHAHTHQSYGAIKLAHSVPVVAVASHLPVVAVESHAPVLAVHSHTPVVALQSHAPVVAVESHVPVVSYEVPASLNYGSSYSSHISVHGHAPAGYAHTSFAHGHSL